MQRTHTLTITLVLTILITTLPLAQTTKQTLIFAQEGAGLILPLHQDTDGDGFPNWYEIKLSTNPLYNDENFFDINSIKLGLSSMERKQLAQLVQINATNPYEAAVEVIDWVSKNIHYDEQAAQKMNSTPLYIGNRVRFPTQAVKTHKAICTGYTLLTDALLLNTHQFNTVYVIIFNCQRKMGHATAAIQINGTYYVLDQHAPPITLNYYLNHFWCKHYTAYLYKITLHNGEPQVEYLGNAKNYAKPVNTTTTLETALKTWGTIQITRTCPNNITIPTDTLQILGDFFKYYLNKKLPTHPTNAHIEICPLKNKIAVKITTTKTTQQK